MTIVAEHKMDAATHSASEWGLISCCVHPDMSVQVPGTAGLKDNRKHVSSGDSGGGGAVPMEEAPPPPPTDTTTPTAHPQDDDGRERRKLQNEDSSYDSDFDPFQEETNTKECPSHEDVCRTVSETLGQEFAEYVTLRQRVPPNLPLHHALHASLSLVSPQSQIPFNLTPNQILTAMPPTLTLTEATPHPDTKAQSSFNFDPPSLPHPPPSTCGSSITLKPSSSHCLTDISTASHSLSSILSCAEYPAQVEFGVKLGYSESLVQLALTKLGPNPDKDKLLDELIRLGAGAPKQENEEETISVLEESETPIVLRPIIIDGSNVAMSHGSKSQFSCRGIRLCVEYFRNRGHQQITVFVPSWRKEASKVDAVITEQELLTQLEDEGVLCFTPSRTISGKRIVAYDDKFIVKEALNTGGIIVSNDNLRDVASESPAYRKVVEESLLMYSFVNGRFEPPDDPMGRNGPSLDVFLRKGVGSGSAAALKDARPCPYGRKCTYGNKCKYMHPERGAAPVKSVTERLQEHAQKHYQDKAKSRDSSPGEGLRSKSLSLPVATGDNMGMMKKPLARTRSNLPSGSLSSPLPGYKECNPGNENLCPPSAIGSSAVGSIGSTHGLRAVSPSSMATSTTGPYSGLGLSHTQFPPHTLSSPQRQVEPLCSSLLKGDSQLFSLCPPNQNDRSLFSTPWNTSRQGHEQHQQLGPLHPQNRFSPLPMAKKFGEIDAQSSDNPHPKLQRQYSINPVKDERVLRMTKHYMGEPPSNDYLSLMSSIPSYQQQMHHLQHQQMLQQSQMKQELQRQMDSDSMAARAHLSSQCASPAVGTFQNLGYNMQQTPVTRHSSMHDSGTTLYQSQQSQHQQRAAELQTQQTPVTRHSSMHDSGTSLYQPQQSQLQQRAAELQTQQQQMYTPPPHYFHSNVTRNRSAPDPIRGNDRQQHQHQLVPHITRLNSTSDSRLNIHPCEQQQHQQFHQDISDPLPPSRPYTHIPSGNTLRSHSPGPIGTRPISPQQQHHSVAPSMIGAAPRPSSLPPPHSMGITNVAPNTTNEDKRFKMLYHLSEVFSEAQVRAALANNPDETDPCKICTYILSMKGGGEGVRAPSPNSSIQLGVEFDLAALLNQK